ncbi:hypothetical protein TAMA11512_05990 [Selenomonas sp. TAMA-11512]|uniref:dihydroneopterin aldolase n=1 Tax=Selenomonas sp. TAMA-11512 TaxID=3095337 RepID=UPI00308B6026|nr:hypothetical protein TAMA11512_05990 [Selenomonas sp. TAMA-11512]
MAKVSIRNMIFYGFQGIYEYEREQGSKLSVDVEMITKDDVASNTDNPDDTVSYAVLYPIIKDAVEESKCNLLAYMAGQVGDEILRSTDRISEVTVRIRKDAVPIPGPLDCVEVEVTRRA